MYKILILEDKPSIRSIIDHSFRNDSFDFLITENFSTGKDSLPKVIPDLVIVDLTTIEKDNVELLMNLKADPVISMVPFLFVASKKKEDIPLNNYYLSKPFKEEDLFKLIEKIFNQTRKMNPW